MTLSKTTLILIALIIGLIALNLYQYNRQSSADIEAEAVKLDNKAAEKRSEANQLEAKEAAIVEDVKQDYKAKSNAAIKRLEYLEKPKTVAVNTSLVEDAAYLEKYLAY